MKKLYALFPSKKRLIQGWVACLFLLLTITQSKATVTIWADTVSGSNGSQVDISVKVRQFTKMISMQGTLQWNVPVATYNSTLAYNLPSFNGANFGTTQVGTGKLTFSWNDPTLLGVTVPPGTTIFKVRYNVVGMGGSSTPVTFVNSPTPLEFVDTTFLVLPFAVNPGRINVTGGACAVTNLTAGTQTACNPSNNTYTQQVSVTYNNAPTTGTLDVNGQSFAITTSPQTVTLTGLTANGLPVNTTASFSASPGCSMTTNSLFTAPASCMTVAPFVIWADTVSGANGTQVDLSVKVTNFTDIISIQGTLSWNTAVASYSATSAYNLPGMGGSNFGTTQVGTGKLTYSWNDGTLQGVTLAPGTTIFKVTYDLVGSGGSSTPVAFVNSPTTMEVVDLSFSPIPYTANPGEINVVGTSNAMRILADSVQGLPLSTVDLPVRAIGFTRIVGAQGTVGWSTAVGIYNSVVTFGLPGMSISNFGTSQIGSGKLTFSWNDGTLVGVTLPDSAILFTVRYNLVGAPLSVCPVTFENSPTPLEFTDSSLTVLPTTSTNGQLRVMDTLTSVAAGAVGLNRIFPNPISNGQDNFTLVLRSSSSEVVNLSLMNVAGQVADNLIRWQTAGPAIQCKLAAPIAAGMWFLKVETSEGIFYEKLMINGL